MSASTEPHPSAYIDPRFTDMIRLLSPEAEQLGQLHPEQLSIIYEKNWFKLFVPKQYGGLELSLPEGLRLLEGLACADGSTGWVTTLCSGANWFIGFLPRELVGELFNNDKVCLAGSGKPSGVARVGELGYRITGYWKYASGAPHATAFTAVCRMEKDGEIIHNIDGSPQEAAFLFLRDDVLLCKNWQAMGMIATASDSFGVSDLELPFNRCFRIAGEHAVLPHPVYQYPFLQLAETTLAVNSAGMAARFLELCGIIFSGKVKHTRDKPGKFPEAQVYLEAVKRQFQEMRQSFYNAVKHSWDCCNATGAIPSAVLRAVSDSSHRIAAAARHSVDELYPFCGMEAANPASEINRVWRNLHTASQHALLAFAGSKTQEPLLSFS
jgi:alkylation response protein AidB-like acyl-CoA dehydrogenase